MKRLRLHIIRLVVILFVGLGFGFSLLQPAKATDTPTAFADWLQTKAKLSNDIKLEKELNNLRNSGRHLDKVVEEASQLVRKNKKAFEFGFSGATANHRVYQLLLIEWNHFQMGNTMAAVTTSQLSKSLFTSKKYALGSNGGFLSSGLGRFAHNKVGQILNFNSAYNKLLTPMVNSIAIGAP